MGEPAKEGTMSAKKPEGFTEEERAAMRERAKEQKAEARAEKNRAEGESAVLAKIAEMQGPDRAMAERLHAIVKASAPVLSPKTWYGMPAYANKDGKVVWLLPKRAEVRREVRDARLQRPGEPRRGRHVADLLRAEGVGRRRRGEDRRVREEGGELSQLPSPAPRPVTATAKENRTYRSRPVGSSPRATPTQTAAATAVSG